MSFPNQPGTFQSASLYVGDLHPEITEVIGYISYMIR